MIEFTVYHSIGPNDPAYGDQAEIKLTLRVVSPGHKLETLTNYFMTVEQVKEMSEELMRHVLECRRLDK